MKTSKKCGELDLSKLYGPRFGPDFDPQTRNIVSGEMLQKAHHCKDRDCNGSATKATCYTNLHCAYCQADVLDSEGRVQFDENGMRKVCGEKFEVISPGGCYQHKYNENYNLGFKALRNGWDHNQEELFQRMKEDEEYRRNGTEPISKHSPLHSDNGGNGLRDLEAKGGGAGCSKHSPKAAAQEQNHRSPPKGKKEKKKKQQPHATFHEMRRGKKAGLFPELEPSP